MKRLLAGVLTAALMAWLLWSGARRPLSETGAGAPSALADAPGAHPAEARVRALLQAAAGGDVPAYLAAFSGPLRARLDREVGERGLEAFASDLRKATTTRKSHAIFAAEPDGDTTAFVTVESVYADRNERQTYRLDRTEAGWTVAEVETVRSHQPQVKIGAPARYNAPEGVPVQGLDPSTGEEPMDDETP